MKTARPDPTAAFMCTALSDAFEDGMSGRFVEVFKASYPHFQDVGNK